MHGEDDEAAGDDPHGVILIELVHLGRVQLRGVVMNLCNTDRRIDCQISIYRLAEETHERYAWQTC